VITNLKKIILKIGAIWFSVILLYSCTYPKQQSCEIPEADSLLYKSRSFRGYPISNDTLNRKEDIQKQISKQYDAVLIKDLIVYNLLESDFFHAKIKNVTCGDFNICGFYYNDSCYFRKMPSDIQFNFSHCWDERKSLSDEIDSHDVNGNIKREPSDYTYGISIDFNPKNKEIYWTDFEGGISWDGLCEYDIIRKCSINTDSIMEKKYHLNDDK
jgi:hypothetical protein